MRAIVIGFGKVGREVVKQARLMGVGIEFVGALSSKGGAVLREREDMATLEELAQVGEGLSEHPSFTPGLSVQDLVKAADPDIAFVAIPPNYASGEPNMSIYRDLARLGVSTVTADKTALAMDFWGTLKMFLSEGARLGYRATVAAGVPMTDVARAIRWRGVNSFTAILNATTNYIISLIESGMRYGEAVSKAIEDGYAEPDPTVDTHGWDPAAKVAIIASILEGRSISVREVERVPLGEGIEELINSARKRGHVIRYVATYERGRGASVKPAELGPNHPLTKASGTHNVAVFRLEGEEVIISGPAGPAWRTARVMIGDALDIAGGW